MNAGFKRTNFSFTPSFRLGIIARVNLANRFNGFLKSCQDARISLQMGKPLKRFPWVKFRPPPKLKLGVNKKSILGTVISSMLEIALLTVSMSQAVYGQASEIPSSQVAKVVAEVRSAAPGDPSLTQALVIGESLNAQRRFTEAAEVFKAILERTPRESHALYGSALAAFNLGRADQAESLIRSTIDVLLPKFPVLPTGLSTKQRMETADALVLSAVILAVRGNDPASLKYAEQATRVAPEHFDAQFTLGRAQFSAGDYVAAGNSFRKALQINPNDVRALFFLGTALERADDLDGALRSYREVIAKAPQAAEGYLGSGTLLVRRGGDQAAEGIKQLQRAIAINPDLYEARLELGKALIAKGRLTEAVVHLVRASELSTGNPEPHYQLALAYRRLGRLEDAAREQAIVKMIHEQRRTGRTGTDSPTP